MPYLSVWIHMIWSTKKREPVLSKEIRTELFAHIRENARAKDIHLDFMNGYLEHVHALISLKPDQSIAKLAQLLKGESSHSAGPRAVQLDLVQFPLDSRNSAGPHHHAVVFFNSVPVNEWPEMNQARSRQ